MNETESTKTGGYPANLDNPDDWAAFLARYLDNRITNEVHNGIGLIALHIVDAIKAARANERCDTVQLNAVWVKGALERSEQDLHLGRERLGSVWKASIGDGWLYALRSDIDSREATTCDAAKIALVALLNQRFGGAP